MRRIFTFLWLFFLYLAMTLFVQSTTDTYKMWNQTFLTETFADIFFDDDDSNKWYNPDNSKAEVSVTPNQIITLPPPPVSRYSH